MIDNSIASDAEIREYIQYIFDDYKNRSEEYHLQKIDTLAMNMIIMAYVNYVKKPEFSIIVENYKKEYIDNEAMVEDNCNIFEKKGLGVVYDYIKKFDFSKDKFNIFVCALTIHSKLYSKCPYSSFGGKLRNNTVYLENANVEVVEPDVAKKYFNSLIQTSDEIFRPLKSGDIIGYINACVVQTVELIKIQPFQDGNKRTFRAVLNLLLKKINIPPIYIEINERKEYIDALLDAMENNNFEPIIKFYYLKICDSIINLDINKSTINNKQKILGNL